jgi:hypothetical protein
MRPGTRAAISGRLPRRPSLTCSSPTRCPCRSAAWYAAVNSSAVWLEGARPVLTVGSVALPGAERPDRCASPDGRPKPTAAHIGGSGVPESGVLVGWVGARRAGRGRGRAPGGRRPLASRPRGDGGAMAGPVRVTPGPVSPRGQDRPAPRPGCGVQGPGAPVRRVPPTSRRDPKRGTLIGQGGQARRLPDRRQAYGSPASATMRAGHPDSSDIRLRHFATSGR